MIIKFFTGAFIILGTACFLIREKSIKFTVINKSNESFDSLIIRSYKLEEVFIHFNPEDSFVKKAKFFSPPGKGEGGFSVSIYQKDSLVYGNVFGYFVDASYVKENYKIIVSENKKVLIKSYP